MSYLKGMIDKAKGWLGSRPALGQETDSVEHDRFDAEVYRQLLDEAPALHKMAYNLGNKYDYSEDLVRDVLMEFWKSDPKLRTEAEMRPEFLHNWAVTQNIAAATETVQARSQTQHNRYGAAMATVAVTEKVQKFLEEHEAEREAAKEAQKKQDEADEAAAQCEQAADQAGDAAGDYEGEGPLTAEQQALADALGQMLGQAQQLAQEAQDATEEAADQMAQAARQLRVPVRQAIAEAGEKLTEEGELFRAWGITDGELKAMSFEERASMARALSNNRLAQFRQLIGRFRMMAAAQRSRKVEYGRDEVVGVELSGDLPRVLGGEFAKSKAHRALRLEFLERLAEEQLLSREYQGVENVGDGAIIACIDCSGSMEEADVEGLTRESWAKAFALALLDQARAGKRDFVAVLFSSRNQIKTFRFPAGKADITQVIEMVELFYGGGTDFMTPMNAAVKILEEEYNTAGKQRGDIVFMTDGACGVTTDWMAEYQARKKKLDFRTFGIQIGEHGYYSDEDILNALSDNVRTVTSFSDPGVVADMMRVI